MRIAQYPKQLTISISEESYSKIRVLSDENQVSMSDVIREIIDKSLAVTTGNSSEDDNLPFLINEK